MQEVAGSSPAASTMFEDDKTFFRYLVSKVVQTTPSTAGPEAYANDVFQRAKAVYARVKEFEKCMGDTRTFSPVSGNDK